MAKVRFNLKRPKEEISSLICTLTDGRGYEIKLSTGISLKTKHWSSKGYILSADLQSSAHNAKIKDWTVRVLGIYNEAQAKGIQPNRQHFYDILKPKAKTEELQFWDYWELYLQSKKGHFQKHTFVKFESLKGHLEGFEQNIKKSLNLNDLTVDLMDDFQTYCYNEGNLNTQSTAKYFSVFKMFLNWCVRRKYTVNIDFREFSPLRQPDGLKVIMTDQDIAKLKSVDLGQKNYLNNVRYLFLLACNTGLRFSDFSRISKEHLKKEGGDYYLSIRQQKTEDYVNIPLTPEALELVNQLVDGKIKAISNQKMNKYVKELCEEAKIDESFEVHKYKGRVKTSSVVPKYELVSTHTGRRTFASKLLERGVAAQVVMSMTGHKDYKSFAKYVNIPRQTEMEIVRKALMMETMRVA